MFFYVVSRTYAEIFSLLQIFPGYYLIALDYSSSSLFTEPNVLDRTANGSERLCRGAGAG